MIIIKLFKTQGNKNPDPVNDPVRSLWHAHSGPVQECLMMNPGERAGLALVQMTQAEKKTCLALQWKALVSLVG